MNPIIGLTDITLKKSTNYLDTPDYIKEPYDMPDFALRLILKNSLPIDKVSLELKMLGVNPPEKYIKIISLASSDLVYEEKLDILGYANSYSFELPTVPNKFCVIQAVCGYAKSNSVNFLTGLLI